MVGDAVYGKSANALARQMGLTRPFLHSHRLQFMHPVTGADVDITEPLPADLQSVLDLLESSRQQASLEHLPPVPRARPKPGRFSSDTDDFRPHSCHPDMSMLIYE